MNESPTEIELSDTQARGAVAEACRILGAQGQGDLIWGHVSMRDRYGRGAWLKSAGWGLEEINAEQVHLVGWDGEVVLGEGRRHIEYPIHIGILKARSDINAVVHTHPQDVVAFGATSEELRPISHDAALFVPPGIARFTATGDLITTPQLGTEVADALGAREAVVLVHHGLVTVGDDLPTAVVRAILFDRACATQLRAQAGGGVHSWSSDDEAISKRLRHGSATNLTQAYEYLRRSLPAPEYADRILSSTSSTGRDDPFSPDR